MTIVGFRSITRPSEVCLLVLLPVLVLLAGCQSIPKQSRDCVPLQKNNLTQFELSGKLALSDGQEGGNGRFTWQQKGLQVTAEFKAPLGQGNWLIKESDYGANLLINNEEPSYAQQGETLIEEAVGWPVPWQALKNWIVAQPLDDSQAEITGDQDTKTISEQGWTIVYDRFQVYPEGCLPHRIMASKPPYSIRLIIRHWRW